MCNRLRDQDNSPVAPLGPFDLLSYLGRGSMGQVWRARHREQQVAAAIKVITGEQAQGTDYHHQFRREVRAAAGLSHPGIVMVFDYGQITERVQQATLGELQAGRPYLAMELCPRGSLAELDDLLSFGEVRSVLLSLLDALAHAHARGVIHRDIKPANILLGEPEDEWTGIKLTDFGLAFVADNLDLDRPSQSGVWGTPAFMSPEQLLGNWRDVGPWSDLYALGCLAFQLTGSRPPFGGRTVVEVAQKHLHKPIPQLAAQIPVPDSFEGWVRRLLQKDRLDRFQTAADAAWALLEMNPPVDAEPVVDGRRRLHIGGHPLDDHASTHVLAEFSQLTDASDSPAASPDRPAHLDVADRDESPDPKTKEGPPHCRSAGAPFPATWQRLIGHRSAVQLQGAGLNLFGLRHIPLVGRQQERDILWRQLGEAIDQSSPRACLLRGPAGAGKSFLAEWVSERSQETGAAIPLHAVHSSGPGGDEALARMLARYFRTAELPRADITERLRQWFVARGVDDPHEWHALTELICPAGGEDLGAGQPKVRLTDRSRRHSLIGRILEVLGRQRAVLVWLDDLQWAPDSLAFVRYCLQAESCRNLPLLLVGTIRQEALVDDADTAQLLADLAVHRRLTELSVGPLSDDDHAELIKQLLSLAPRLARRVADRTEGNPLFATQLIGDWVDRGLLEATDDGFVLRDGQPAEVPDDLVGVWSDRLSRVLEGASPADLRALELAATLGNEVRHADWRACLRLAGMTYPTNAVEALLSHRLVEPTDTGIRFVHGMLREALQRRARRADRFVEHNRVCANMLGDRPADQPRLAGRIGRHLLAARAYREALAPLVEGAKSIGNAGDVDALWVLLDLHLDAMDALNLPAACPSRVQNDALRGIAYAGRGNSQRSYQLGRRAVATAREIGESDLVARACVRLAQSHIAQSKFQQAVSLHDQARQLIDPAADDPELVILLESSQGRALAKLGRGNEASARLITALQAAREVGDRDHQAYILRSLGSVERHRGNWAAAESYLTDALEVCDDEGLYGISCYVLISLGDVVRLQGRLGEAERLYRTTIERCHWAKPMIVPVARLNLALVWIQTDQYDQARSILDELDAFFSHKNQPGYVFYTRTIALPCLAARSQWDEFDRQLTWVIDQKTRLGISDPDLTVPIEQAGRLAADADRRDRARRALQQAAQQWQSMGNDANYRAAKCQLDRLAKGCSSTR